MTEITEIVTLDAERVDAVRQPANGFPILLMKAVDRKGRIDETPDIAGAENVLTLLANLIISEAQEMAAGHFDEVCDIDILTEAAHLIRGFKMREKWTAEAENGEAAKGLSDEDYEKAARLLADRDVAAVRELIASRETNNEDAMSETDKTSAPVDEAVKETTESPDIDNLVKSAVAEANSVSEQRIKALEDQLAKVLATPIPGGPAMTAPAHMRTEAQKAEKLAEAARYTRLAENVTDPELQRYYKERADAAKASA